MAVLLASTSDLDDLIPTLVAYQVEWNKLHAAAALLGPRRRATSPTRRTCAEAFGGAADDWIRIREAWGDARRPSWARSARASSTCGSACSAARRPATRGMTRRWWRAGAQRRWTEQGLGDRPIYFVSSNPHSLVNLVTPTARAGEDEIVALRRAARARLPARGARALPRAGAPRARGRTSSTSARACCGSRCPRTGRSGGSGSDAERAARRHAHLQRAPRCACRHR